MFLFTRSFVQAGLATALVALSFVWMRGEIGILFLVEAINPFVFPAFLGIKERVYSQLAYTVCIVQEVSFLLHMIHAYQVHGCWVAARRSIWGAILKTALIAFFGFVIAYFSLPIKMIQEVAVLSALGVINLVLISLLLLPEMHSFFVGRDRQIDLPSWLDLEKMLSGVANRCAQVGLRLSIRESLAIMMCLGLVIACFSCRIPIGGNPIEYIKGTNVWKATRYLSDLSRPGSTLFDFWIEPADDYQLSSKEVILDSKFSGQVWGLIQDVERVESVRSVSSILHSVARISEQSFKMDFPNDNQLLFAAFEIYISGSIDSEVRDQVYDSHKGYRVVVSTASDFVGDWERICESIIALEDKYPGLKISGFGNTSLYARVAHYITSGAIWNILGDSINIFVLYGMFTAIAFRKFWLSIRMGLAATVPFVFAAECLVVIMIIFEIPLDISTALIAPCAVAAAIDFSIYILEKYQKSESKDLRVILLEEGPVVLADCVSNQALFAPLLTSGFVPVQRLGWMLVGMLFFSAIGALVIMPPFLRK
jgi:predicted RND superfamily exporter protein